MQRNRNNFNRGNPQRSNERNFLSGKQTSGFQSKQSLINIPLNQGLVSSRFGTSFSNSIPGTSPGLLGSSSTVKTSNSTLPPSLMSLPSMAPLPHKQDSSSLFGPSKNDSQPSEIRNSYFNSRESNLGAERSSYLNSFSLGSNKSNDSNLKSLVQDFRCDSKNDDWNSRNKRPFEDDKSGWTRGFNTTNNLEGSLAKKTKLDDWKNLDSKSSVWNDPSKNLWSSSTNIGKNFGRTNYPDRSQSGSQAFDSSVWDSNIRKDTDKLGLNESRPRLDRAPVRGNFYDDKMQTSLADNSSNILKSSGSFLYSKPSNFQQNSSLNIWSRLDERNNARNEINRLPERNNAELLRKEREAEIQRKKDEEIRLRIEREERLRKEHEEKLRKEREEMLRKEREEKLRKEREEKIRKEQEERLKKENEERLKKEREERLKKEREERLKKEREMRLKKQKEEMQRKQEQAFFLKQQQKDILLRQQEELLLRKQQEELLLRKQQEELLLRKQQEESWFRVQQEELFLRKQQEEKELYLMMLKAKQQTEMEDKLGYIDPQLDPLNERRHLSGDLLFDSQLYDNRDARVGTSQSLNLKDSVDLRARLLNKRDSAKPSLVDKTCNFSSMWGEDMIIVRSVNRGYELKSREISILKDLLSDHIHSLLDNNEFNIQPRIKGSTRVGKGWFLIHCGDQETLEWLLKWKPPMTSKFKRKLVVRKASDAVRTTDIAVTLRNFKNKDIKPNDIQSLIIYQNRHLNSEAWVKGTDNKEVNSGTRVSFTIDRACLELLKKHNNKVFFELGWHNVAIVEQKPLIPINLKF